MKRMQVAVMALSVALAVNSKAQDHAPLKLVATIPLPGLHDGDFDHFAPDVDGHRLFLTGEENEKVLVFDTTTNQLIHTIEDVKADRKSTRLNSSHSQISYAVFCLNKQTP